MIAEIENYLDQLVSIKQAAPGLVSGLSVAQLNWRPAPDRWSIAQVLEHLNITADTYLPAIDGAVARGRASGVVSTGPFAYGLFERWWVKTMDAPPRRRFRAPGTLRPTPDALNGDVVQQFYDRQEAIAERLRRADGLDLRRVRVPLPMLPLYKMTLGQSFALMLAHERRHIWQAAQIRNDSRLRSA